MSKLRWLAPVAVVATLCLGAAPASAEVTPTPSPTTSSAAASSEATSSLSGALVNLYAQQAGLSLDQYLSAAGLKVESTDGSAVLVTGDEADASAQTLNASTLGDLDAQLDAAGYSLDLSSYTSVKDLAADVVAKAHTADASVTLASAQWMAQLASLRTDELTTPAVADATMPSIPAAALPYGLLVDQALANTVLHSPDLFAAATASGVGSQALSDSFKTEMLNAYETSGTQLESVLANKCAGAMLSVMASGTTASADNYTGCATACVTGGLYLNNQISMLFNPASGMDDDDLDGDKLWALEELGYAQQWRTEDLLEQNPDLVAGILSDDGTAGGATMCSAASTSATQILQDTLPNLFSSLRTK